MEKAYVILSEDFDERPEAIGVIFDKELAETILKELNKNREDYTYYLLDEVEVWG